MSWQEVQLGDGIHVKHGFAFKGEYFSASGEYLVLTPGNFLEKGGFRVRDGKERFYHADFTQDYLLSEDDWWTKGSYIGFSTARMCERRFVQRRRVQR